MKKQAGLVRMQQSLPSQPEVKSKSQRKRSNKSKILGAVDGMRSSLEELLAANERKHREQAAAEEEEGAALTSKKRQKLVVEEMEHMKQVLSHPQFVEDPFGALQQHLANTVTAAARGDKKDRRWRKKEVDG